MWLFFSLKGFIADTQHFKPPVITERFEPLQLRDHEDTSIIATVQ